MGPSHHRHALHPDRLPPALGDARVEDVVQDLEEPGADPPAPLLVAIRDPQSPQVGLLHQVRRLVGMPRQLQGHPIDGVQVLQRAFLEFLPVHGRFRIGAWCCPAGGVTTLIILHRSQRGNM